MLQKATTIFKTNIKNILGQKEVRDKRAQFNRNEIGIPDHAPITRTLLLSPEVSQNFRYVHITMRHIRKSFSDITVK